MYAVNIEELKKDMKIPKTVKLFDTTLRDGEQTPGVGLTIDEKIQIASKLDNLGIDTIEVGFPASSNGELESAKKIKSLELNSQLCGLARTLKKDIDAVIDSDLNYVHTFIGSSPLHRNYKLKKSKEEIIEIASSAIEYGKDHGLTVEFSAEDGTRTEIDYLIKLYKEAENAGADVLNIPDTVGILVPSTSAKLISKLKSNLKKPLSVHFHNDFGLAVANSIIAIENGANQVHCTVNGIGERGGNASLEELVIALKLPYGVNFNLDTTQLYNLSHLVSSMTGIKIPPTKAIVGENAFVHESGIHVDGILKHSETYEPIPPELVGHKRKIALGKHTGNAAIKSKLKEFNIETTKKQFDSIYKQIKDLGDKGKCITDADLKAIALTEISTVDNESIKLLGLTVMTGNNVSATATVKLEIDGKVSEISKTGVGPIDASLNAIKYLVANTIEIELEEYNIGAIGEGTNALAETFVKIADKEGNHATGRATRDDVIMSSVIAVLNSLNKLLVIKKNKNN